MEGILLEPQFSGIMSGISATYVYKHKSSSYRCLHKCECLAIPNTNALMPMQVGTPVGGWQMFLKQNQKMTTTMDLYLFIVQTDRTLLLQGRSYGLDSGQVKIFVRRARPKFLGL